MILFVVSTDVTTPTAEALVSVAAFRRIVSTVGALKPEALKVNLFTTALVVAVATVVPP